MSIKMQYLCISLWVTFLLTIALASARTTFVLDQDFVCNIKRSCVECLRLGHCSWCEVKNKCFSKQLQGFQDFCKNDTTDYKDHGFSLQENAECSCGSYIKGNCYSTSTEEGEPCSGRGKCVCGRCICDANSDPKHPTKQIVGEYCEFDNFSCDGPHCNEGPYPFSQSKMNKENSIDDVEEPSEVE